MYNLNVNLATGPGNPNLLSLETGCTTPKTPEILNSLIAMTNPFDGYSVHRNNMVGPRIATCPPTNSDSSSSGSPLGSPGTPPSVQHTCSQLIKEGLKLTIQTKRRHNGQDADHDDPYHRPQKMARRDEVSLHNDDDDDDYDDLFSPGLGLTAEDEERRRRRRERNKVAATKCRLKKRERTVNLVQSCIQESEILENQNHDLKNQIQELETQRRRLMDMLSMHRPTCIKNQGGHPPSLLNHIQYSPNQDIDTGLKYSTPQDLDPHTPSSSYCSDTPLSSYCSSSPLDTPVTASSSYGHYTIDSCNYSGGYTSQGMDNGGCMA